MSLPPLLFAGFPGGLEMLVVLFVFFVLFGVPVTLLVALGYRHLQNSTEPAQTERLETLEAEVEDLRERLDASERGAEPASDPRTGSETRADGATEPGSTAPSSGDTE